MEPILQSTTLSTIIDAITGLLSLLLTGLLVYFYRGMKVTQEKQADILQKQTSIQESQTEIQEKQVEISRGSNRPLLTVDIDAVSEDTIELSITNAGNGIARRVDLEWLIFLPCNEIERLEDKLVEKSTWEEDIQKEVVSDTDVVEISNIPLRDIDIGPTLSVVRPEKKTTDTVSISRSENGLKCYVKPKCEHFYNGEYYEPPVSELITQFQKIGIERAFFIFNIRYGDLTGFSYYTFLTSRYVTFHEVEDLEDILEIETLASVMDYRTQNTDYHERQYKGPIPYHEDSNTEGNLE